MKTFFSFIGLALILVATSVTQYVVIYTRLAFIGFSEASTDVNGIGLDIFIFLLLLLLTGYSGVRLLRLYNCQTKTAQALWLILSALYSIIGYGYLSLELGCKLGIDCL